VLSKLGLQVQNNLWIRNQLEIKTKVVYGLWFIVRLQIKFSLNERRTTFHNVQATMTLSSIVEIEC